MKSAISIYSTAFIFLPFGIFAAAPSFEPWSQGAAGATAAVPDNSGIISENPAALAGLERSGLDAALNDSAYQARISGNQWGGWSLSGLWLPNLPELGTASFSTGLPINGIGGSLGMSQALRLSGQAWSMGLGWQKQWMLPEPSLGRLSAGIYSQGLFGDGQSDSQAGLAWCLGEDGWISLQCGRSESLLEWRLGAQAQLGRGVSVRAGISGSEGGMPLASCGFGYLWRGWDFAYAASASAGGWSPDQSSEVRQSFGLRRALGRPREGAPKAELAKLLRDGALDGAVVFARIRLWERPEGPQSWSLSLFNTEGREEARFEGKGSPKAELRWDGKDAAGLRSRSRRWRYESRIKAKNGDTLARQGWLEAPGDGPGLAQTQAAWELMAENEDGYGLRRAPAAGLLRKGKAKLPTIQLSTFKDVQGMEGEESDEWKLVIQGEGGEFTRTFKGRGPIPPSLAWDGLDDEGRAVRADGMRYSLKLSTASGKILERRSVLAPMRLARPEGAGLGGEEGDGAGAFGLRQGARRAKPALVRGKDLRVATADFDFNSEGSDAGDWILRVRDGQGRTVRSLSGRGKPPKGLRWDGLDDSGAPAMLDLGASYDMRVTDASGKESSFKDDLVAERDFESLAAEAKAASRIQALSACRPSGEPGCLRCLVHFPYAEESLGDQGKLELADIRRTLSGARPAELRIEGHADSSGECESNLMISQARANNVLELLLDGMGVQPNLAVATGLGDSRPVKDEDSEEARALNRRVELIVKF